MIEPGLENNIKFSLQISLEPDRIESSGFSAVSILYNKIENILGVVRV